MSDFRFITIIPAVIINPKSRLTRLTFTKQKYIITYSQREFPVNQEKKEEKKKRTTELFRNPVTKKASQKEALLF